MDHTTFDAESNSREQVYSNVALWVPNQQNEPIRPTKSLGQPQPLSLGKWLPMFVELLEKLIILTLVTVTIYPRLRAGLYKNAERAAGFSGLC
jgi:hypothetical protein